VPYAFLILLHIDDADIITPAPEEILPGFVRVGPVYGFLDLPKGQGAVSPPFLPPGLFCLAQEFLVQITRQRVL
jgi:hypothetical protein